MISLDMGGTTAKAAMIENGEPVRTTEYEVGGGINLSQPARQGRRLRDQAAVHRRLRDRRRRRQHRRASTSSARASVGPRSAGAVPGPVCYGAGGTEPTLTDALVVLGYLNPEAPRRRRGAARRRARRATAIERAGRGAARPVAARGRARRLRVAVATMTRAVKAVSTYRGRDPRDFVLLRVRRQRAGRRRSRSRAR